ncbi:MAG: response regulator [Planctomycetales bacterium]|nr:response regulator [Planctomycetales bacterium]
MAQTNIFSNASNDGGSSAAVSPEAKLQPQPTDLAGRRVLVLEDDPVQQQLLAQYLRALGLQVVAATTIAEAKQRLSESVVQLAILDVQLPDGSGFELCEQLDSDPNYAGLPMIVLSSLSGAEVVRQTRAAGGVYYLAKPYDPNVLVALIENVFGERFR